MLAGKRLRRPFCEDMLTWNLGKLVPMRPIGSPRERQDLLMIWSPERPVMHGMDPIAKSWKDGLVNGIEYGTMNQPLRKLAKSSFWRRKR